MSIRRIPRHSFEYTAASFVIGIVHLKEPVLIDGAGPAKLDHLLLVTPHPDTKNRLVSVLLPHSPYNIAVLHSRNLHLVDLS
jgi:hypothetical protein